MGPGGRRCALIGLAVEAGKTCVREEVDARAGGNKSAGRLLDAGEGGRASAWYGCGAKLLCCDMVCLILFYMG